MSGDSLSYFAQAASVAISLKQANDAKKAGARNAEISLFNARQERAAAEENARRHERQSRMRLGQLRTGTIASGIELSGSTLDLIEDSAREEELARQDILKQGEARAKTAERTADIERKDAKAKSTTALAQAGATLFSGLAKA